MMSEKELELKQFVWAYMLQAGIETTGEWGIYHGQWISVGGKTAEKTREDTLRKLKQGGGIDWEKTTMPASSRQYEFDGTESPGRYHDAVLGDLVLKNGDRLKIGVGGEELRFQNYIAQFHYLTEDRQRVIDIIGE